MTQHPVSSIPGDGDAIWLPVRDVGSIGTARRAATSLAGDIGLAPARAADLAIVATELATNLVRHAVDGTILVRPVRSSGHTGVQIVAMDSGPGVADLRESTRDGHSTAGTLGIGLGAVIRKATDFDAYSLVGAGTVIVATVLPAGTDPPPGGAAGISRPMAGERVCGDAYALRTVGDRVDLMLCDGLGHGPLAAFAAQAAVTAFQDGPDAGPGALIEHVHHSLRHTRGVVATVVGLDARAATARFAGLGNVYGAVVRDGARQVLVPQPGIVGERHVRVREVEVALPEDSVVVMHSDGVRDRWSLADYPGLVGRTAMVIASTLLRDCGVQRDDAAVLVAKVGPS